MDKIAQLETVIEEKNTLLKGTADQLEKIGEEITTLKQENINIKEENQVLTDGLEKANEKIAKFEKKAAARELVEDLVLKGQVDPLKVEETIADFTGSSDSIEKISELTSKLQGNIGNIGEIINKKEPMEKKAEESHTSDADLANMMTESFKKQVK